MLMSPFIIIKIFLKRICNSKYYALVKQSKNIKFLLCFTNAWFFENKLRIIKIVMPFVLQSYSHDKVNFNFIIYCYKSSCIYIENTNKK